MFRTTNPIQAPRKSFRMDWKETVAQVTAGLLLGALGVIAVNTALGASTSPSNAVTPACATEDSTGCFWAGDSQGNGTGESFYVDAEGRTYYLPETECQDNLKAWTRDAQQMIEDMDSRWASSVPYSDSVRADNIDPMSSRLEYVLEEVCK